MPLRCAINVGRHSRTKLRTPATVNPAWAACTVFLPFSASHPRRRRAHNSNPRIAAVPRGNPAPHGEGPSGSCELEGRWRRPDVAGTRLVPRRALERHIDVFDAPSVSRATTTPRSCLSWDALACGPFDSRPSEMRRYARRHLERSKVVCPFDGRLRWFKWRKIVEAVLVVLAW